MRLLIVGGVAAGTSAAAKARRHDENAEILLFERGEHIATAGCGLPYYVSGVIEDAEDLWVQSVDGFARKHNVQVYTRHEVLAIDRDARVLVIRDLESGEERRESYDILILATGAAPIIPAVPGVESRSVYTLRTVESAIRIRAAVEKKPHKRVVIVGGGLIGLEMAESFLEQGVRVSIVEKLSQILTPLDWEMSEVVRNHLEEEGAAVILSDGLAEIQSKDGAVSAIRLESGRVLDADLLLLSIGIRPGVQLARDAGLAIGPTGAISVDRRMCTSDVHIFAAGDCCETRHLITHQPAWFPLGSIANKQGRTAGANAVGEPAEFTGALGTVIAKICKLTVAATGLTERAARDAGYRPMVSYVHPGSHAHYYPGAEPVHVKLVSDAVNGRLIGAQVIGEDGVDKRIDVFATAMYNAMPVQELFQLDLAYAPPFSSAKDPVIVAGLVAQNCRTGRCLSPLELHDRLQAGDNLRIVDVREPDEYAENHLPGAESLPLSQIRQKLDEFPEDRETVVYCQQGLRGYLASRILLNHGLVKIWNLSGGIESWPFDLDQ